MRQALELIDAVSMRYRNAVQGLQAQLRLAAAGADRGGKHLRDDMRSIRTPIALELAPHEDGPLLDFTDDLVSMAEVFADQVIDQARAQELYGVINSEVEIVTEKVRDALRSDENAVLRMFQQQRLGRLLHKNTARVDFVRPDRAGRKWQTAVMVATTVRELGVDTYNHAMLLALLSKGATQARIGPTAFTIVGSLPGMPTLAEIEDRMHPNAEHLVEPL